MTGSSRRRTVPSTGGTVQTHETHTVFENPTTLASPLGGPSAYSCTRRPSAAQNLFVLVDRNMGFASPFSFVNTPLAKHRPRCDT